MKNKDNSRLQPGPAVKVLEFRKQRMQVYDLITKRLAGDWARRSVLSIDPDGNRHLIVDDGQCLKTDDMQIECREPLSGLARILSKRKLNLLDRQKFNHNFMLSVTEAMEYIRESGLQVAATDATLYRFQNGTILTGNNAVDILPDAGEYLPEYVLTLFSSLDNQPLSGCTKAECRI